MRFLHRLTFPALAILLLTLGVPKAHAINSGDCDHSPGTAVTYFEDCDCYACAYTGPGCTYCWSTTDAGDLSTYASCYTSSNFCNGDPQLY